MESLTYYYKVLNLEPGSTKEDIKRAYRKLAQQWHPDKFLKQPHQLKEARERFELVKEAYDRLINFSYIEIPEIKVSETEPHISVRTISAQEYYEEGILYLQEDKYEQAIESFSQAIRKKSDYLKAYQARAFILEQLGLHLRAKLDFEKVADLKRHHPSAPSQKKPADAELYFQQGLVQFQARKYGAAIEILSQAIAINSNHQEAYRYRSQAYFRRGYDQQADADFKRMRELEQQVKHSAPTPPNPQPSSHYSTWHCAYTLSRHTQTVAAVAITRDGKKLVTGSHDRTLRLWSTKTGSLLKTFSDHTKAIYCVAVSWDGKLAASGGVAQTIKIWDMRTGELLRSLGNLFLGHSETITALAFSPNGQTLVSTSLDKTVRLWSLKSGKEIYTLKDYTADILALAISWDGKTIVYGGEGKLLSMRHTKTGKLIRSFPIDGQPNRTVALSRQGSLLAVGSSTEIILWNSHYRKKLLQLKGHTKTISSLSFSADSQILVSGSYDKTVRLWNANTGETLDILTGHRAAVCSVAYSLDGKLIASSSADKTVRLWHRS